MAQKYDVIIVGAGPAGIFTALELCGKADLKVLILDKGEDIQRRIALAHSEVINARRRAFLCGWGGAGAFSDGKLTLSSEVGGQLNEFIGITELDGLIDYVDRVYVKFGAPENVYGTDEEYIRGLERQAILADMKLVPTRVRHLGTERCPKILEAMREGLAEHVAVKTGLQVNEILTRDGQVKGVKVASDEEFLSDYVVVAPGREGAAWLEREAQRLGLEKVNNPVDVGVRVEVPAATLEHITDKIYEPKLIFYSKSFDDKVRTFCVCPYGEVMPEYYEGVVTVNGHSYAARKSGNTNFAVLVSVAFTEPFKEPITYGKYLASLANLLSDGVIVQRLGDLKLGRRSTYERIERGIVTPTLKDAVPGDLSFVIPYRYLSDILEMLGAIDKIAPGVNSSYTLLYGLEVKFYSSRLKLTLGLETEVKNLFAIGDGAGLTRGLIQASVSGVIVAREILKRLT